MDISPIMMKSDPPFLILPVFEDTPDMTKELYKIKHDLTTENRLELDEISIYTDASKHHDGVGCAWVAVEQVLADTPRKGRLPDNYNIVEAKLIGMLGALREWHGCCEQLFIYSNCQPALKLIRSMSPTGERAAIWHMFAPALNDIAMAITFGWSPGHVGIVGNELADRATNTASRLRPLGGFTHDIDFGLSLESAAYKIRFKMWREYHILFDRTYYDRMPKSPKFMKGMTRMGYECLIWLRSGTHVWTPCNSVGKDDRLHLWGCDKFAAGRPVRSPTDDRHAEKLCVWAASYNYLGQGIPQSLPGQDGVLVMGGNPFDHTIIIDDGNGVRTVPVLQTRECSQCGEMCKGGSGCLRLVMRDPPRKYLFFATNDAKTCGQCGVHMSNSAYLQKRTTCVDGWTAKWQKKMAESWSDLDLGVRNTITIRLANDGKTTQYPVCPKVYKHGRIVYNHLCVADGDGCFEVLLQQMADRLVAWG